MINMKFILGKKVNMAQIFKDDGKVVPVTVVQAGPCQITQVKTKEKEGYNAVQIGFIKVKKQNKPEKGHSEYRHLTEFVVDKENELKKGDNLDVSQFEVGEKIKVTGTSKGKGFQGVVRRHGFHGGPASHGHKDQLRMPGSIGACSYPGRVFKGKRMGGQMGNVKCSVRNLEVVKVDKESNLIYLKGAVPGARNGLLIIQN